MSVQGWIVQQTSSALGTVTSVGLSLPASLFTVSGSPVTTAGTLTGTLITQTANNIFAGPASGAAAAPTFRALVADDIPDLSGTYAKLNAANNFTADNIFSSTGYLQVPVGTTVQQPGSPANGMIRLNTTTGRYEFYNASWMNYVRLSGDTMTGDLTVPNLQVTGTVKILDTTQKNALDVATGNNLRVGSGFSSVTFPSAIVIGGAATTSTIQNGSSGGQTMTIQTLGAGTVSPLVIKTGAGAGTSGADITLQTSNGAGGNTSTANINLLIGTKTGSGTNGNIALLTTGSFGSGEKVIFIGNSVVSPTSNPTGGGILYVESGALKYRGSSGTVTTLAVA